ncbi:hypothetical protein H9Q73_014370 [Fusarium xylarioides]|nr:hypothetical protein H9Q73_014370 [Fusarium xylarioides]
MLQATKLNAIGGLNVRIIRLQSTENWVEWLTELRVHTMSLGIWKHVNPSVAESDDDYLVYPVKCTWEEYKTKHIDNDPVLSQESMSTQLQFYNIANTSYNRDVHIYKERLAKEKALREWIKYENEYAPLRKLVQGIKKQYAPSDVQVLSALRREYHLVLGQAKYASIKPIVWYERWNSFYERAIAYDLNEIKGDVAVTDFLQAVGDRFEPLWARNKLNKHTIDVSRVLPTRSELIAEIKMQNHNIKASEVS